MKKAIFILVAIAAFALMAGVALAAPPTFGDVENGRGLKDGGSLWEYSDSKDAAAKREGSYRLFDDTSTAAATTRGYYNWATDNPTTAVDETNTGPHGGYNTTTNKCKTCHAVHRATGTFGLLRGDDADTACDYCHIGASRHSVREAYYNTSAANGKYAPNGHTIGAGTLGIPDSSVLQTEPTGTEGRTYEDAKNLLMKWITHGGRWIRVGPTNLRCASCHQVHNAVRQVWKPGKSADGGATKWVNGYKLLRLSPSGGIQQYKNADGVTPIKGKDASGGNVFASDYRFDPSLGYIDIVETDTANKPYDARLKVPEGDSTSTIDVDTGIGGVDITGYTTYKYFGDGKFPGDASLKNMKIYETSLAFWCADCHNLNIAGKALATAGNGLGKFGASMLADRSHAVPAEFTTRGAAAAGGSGLLQCYSCHNNDMPYVKNTVTTPVVLASGKTADPAIIGVNPECGACHVTPQMYRLYADASDFPHSGQDVGYKLLNGVEPHNDDATKPWSNTYNATDLTGNYAGGAAGAPAGIPGGAGVRGANNVNADRIDTICLICHGPEGGREIGYDK